MTYRIFLFSNVSVTFVILLSTYNIKILILIVSSLNEFECVVLRVITFVLIDILVILVMNSCLSLMNLVSSSFILILVNSSITFYCLETSFSSISLSLKSSSNSFSKKNESFKILNSSSLESVSLFSMILSR